MSSQRPTSFRDLKILITGASGGIGSAIVQCASHQGATVGLMGRDSKRLANVAEQAIPAGAHVSIYAGDLADRDYLFRTVKSFSDEMDGIDVVIHAAGVGLRGRFEATRIEKELEVITANLTGSISLIKTVMPALIGNGWGHFVNLSALGAYYWAPFQSSYVASKVGFLAYCTSLNYELRKQNVFISNVIFAGVDTPFIDGTNYEVYRKPGRLVKPEIVAKKVIEKLLVPRQNLVIGSQIDYWISRISMFAPGFFQKIIEQRNPLPTDDV